MTSISNIGHNHTQAATQSAARGSSDKTAATANTVASAAAGDTVEISDEARVLLANEEAAGTYKPWSCMEYEKVLARGSKEEKQFRELMKSVKTQKSDIAAQIGAALKKAGLSQQDIGNAKIEVDSRGKIYVGGIGDTATKQAVEKALNADKTLGQGILQYQKDEKELSRQIKDYTGCSLYELTMTAQGDINSRIRSTVEEGLEHPPSDEYYWNLGFLGETYGLTVSTHDVLDLGFHGGIDFSGETNVMAEPERNIKNELQTVNQRIKDEFAAINQQMLDQLEAAGVELTDEMKEQYLLDLKDVVITIDSLGGVQIEGMTAKSKSKHEQGVRIIQKLAMEMLNKTEDNSYRINIFTEASEEMIRRVRDDMGSEADAGWDAKVVGSISNGLVKDIHVSSPQLEGSLQQSIQDGVNDLVKGAGVNLAAPLQIEIDDAGKIRAINLPEAGPDKEKIQALLEKINESVKKREPSEKMDDEEEAVADRGVDDWEAGIASISEHLSKFLLLRDG